MPSKPQTPCNKPGCPNLTNAKYCDEHISLNKPAQRQRTNDYDKHRPNATQRGYDHKWKAYRKEFLKRNPKCEICGAPATIVDHRIPHKGNKGLFWTRFNHAPMCTSCHSRKTIKHDMGSWN